MALGNDGISGAGASQQQDGTSASASSGENAGASELGLVKATIVNTASGESLDAMFNPSEYTITRNAVYTEAVGRHLRASSLGFSVVRRRQMEINFFFDTTDTGEDVSVHTGKLERFMDLVEKDQRKIMPILIFTWNSLKFTCVLEDLIMRFFKFDAEGIPLRVVAKCVFSEYSGTVHADSDEKSEGASDAGSGDV